MPPLPKDAGAPAAASAARGTGAFPTVESIDRAMSQSRETVLPMCARGSGGARSRGAARCVDNDRGGGEERESWKQTLSNAKPIEEGLRGLAHQVRELHIVLWISPGRHSLALLIIGTVFDSARPPRRRSASMPGTGHFTKRLRIEISRPSWTSSWFS
jgi:hypothetical protein